MIRIHKIKIVNENITVSKFLELSALDNKEYLHPHICAVVKKNKLVGSLSYGDIKRRYSNIKKNLPINRVMNKNPFYAYYSPNNKIFVSNLIDIFKKKNLETIYVVDRKKKVLGIVEANITKDFSSIYFCNTSVIGMGLVGLTLGIHLARHNIKVVGYDNNNKLINELRKNNPPIYEVGLNQGLKLANNKKLISFENIKNLDSNNKIFIICVATPVINKVIKIDSIKKALKQISKVLSSGSLVILRSTIPVGYSNKVFIPYLEKLSKKKCGSEWHYIFAPERTAEGNALNELNTLPQIIAGFSPECLKLGKTYFNHFSSQLVELQKLEMAEYSKLICNAYRDLTFSFANDVALLSEKYDINANKLILMSNKGYPRGGIPIPSPGVGGSCLTKDPFIYSLSNIDDNFHKSELGFLSRRINNKAGKVPEKILKNFEKSFLDKNKNISVLILGLSFKGDYSNKDYRDSNAKKLADLCVGKKYSTFVYDPAFSKKEINFLGYKYFDISKLVSKKINFIFIMNNNMEFKKINLGNWLKSKKLKVLFDGWCILPELEYEEEYYHYTTMGKLR